MQGTCENPAQKCCKPAGTDGDADGEADTDTDTDTDTDIDIDTDTDSDTDADSDADGTDSDPGTDDGKGLTIYYIRHGETMANVSTDTENIDPEQADVFTDLGIQQVEELSEYLINELGAVPDEILVSPAPRAQNTIEPYLIASARTGVIWPELNECCTGNPSGASIPTKPPSFLFPITIEAENLSFRDEESDRFWYPVTYEDGIYMVRLVYELVIERYSQSGKILFIVGHAGAGRTLIGMLTGHDMVTNLPDGVFLLNTGVQHIVQDPVTGTFTLEGMNINNPTWKP